MSGAGSGEQGTGNRGQEAALEAPGLVGRSGWDLLALVAFTLGLLLRLFALFRSRPLNLDEAMLAVNIMGRGPFDLLRPLGLDQAAPPLFLWVTRGLGLVGGGSELSLRLLPFIAGVAMMPLVWLCARRLMSTAAATIAVLLVALSPSLVDYSVEVKPYILDATLLVGGLWLAMVIPASSLRGWGWWRLCTAGLLVMLGSYAAPWALSLAGVVLITRAIAERWQRANLLALAALGACLMMAFGVLYVSMYSTAGANQYLRDFWHDAFLQGAHALRMWVWAIGNAIADPFPLPAEGVRMAVLAPSGILLLMAAGRRFGLAAAAPWIICTGLLMLASGLGLYPTAPRLVLFLAPLSLMLVAGGLVALVERTTTRAALQVLLVLGVIGAGSTWAWVDGRFVALRSSSRDAAMEFVLERDLRMPVYLVSASGPRYLYYSTDWAQPDLSRLKWFVRTLSWGGEGFRDARAALGLGPADTLPLTRPGGSTELVAYASGAAHREDESPAPGWAGAEIARLVRSGYAQVLVFAGGHHRRELSPLLTEAGLRSIGWEEWYRGPDGVVGVLSFPMPGVEGDRGTATPPGAQ